MVGGSILVEGTPVEIASDPQVRAVYLGKAARA
jgi:ABC-type branched-subunit amino acid transport system ATPase component